MADGYTVETSVRRLTKAGCKFAGGKIIEIREGSIGLRMWALVDFLCNTTDHSFKIIKSAH